MSQKEWPYADIVNLPHHVSEKHPRMEMIKRAAQFAPFAALTGYEDEVMETARLTDAETELDESELAALDRTVRQAFSDGKRVEITYFVPDAKKSGGKYETAEGMIRKIETGDIVLDTGLRIPLTRVSSACTI